MYIVHVPYNLRTTFASIITRLAFGLLQNSLTRVDDQDDDVCNVRTPGPHPSKCRVPRCVDEG